MTPNRIVATVFALAVMAGYSGPQKSWAAPAPAEPGVYGQERWEIPPGEFNEIQRRGFHDGIEGARKDYGNHRNPDVDNREEYRHPDMPGELREPYREAFRRGYREAASHLWGGGQAPPPPPPPPVAQPPRQDWDAWGQRGLESHAEREGYGQGAMVARRDYELQRRPDPDNHPEYRNPEVAPEVLDEYREGFMRGYEVTMSQLSGEQAWRDNRDPNQWVPPDRFTEMQRRGFHDGVEGAKRDFGNHRRPNVANRDEYREPRVDQAYWREYREGFRRGYEMAASQLWGGM